MSMFISGKSVAVSITYANGKQYREEVIVETESDTAACILALEACQEAYRAANIQWVDVVDHPSRQRYIEGRGPTYGVWFAA